MKLLGSFSYETDVIELGESVADDLYYQNDSELGGLLMIFHWLKVPFTVVEVLAHERG